MNAALPILGAIVGAAVWSVANHFFDETFGEQTYLGSVLDSTLNAATFGLSGACLLIIFGRYRFARENDRAKRSSCPEGDEFLDFSQVDQFVKRLAALGWKRHLPTSRLLAACFEAVRRNWFASAADAALNTQFAIEKEVCANRYLTIIFMTSSITLLGFLGTVYGLSTGIGCFDAGATVAATQIAIAFNTSAVALLCSVICGFFGIIVERYDRDVLANAVDFVHHNFVLRIRKGVEHE